VLNLISKKPAPAVNSTTIPTANNQSVVTNDFISTAKVSYDRSVVIYFDSNFTIQFDKPTNTFQITFISSDIATLKSLRPQAEDILLKNLNITQAEACQLAVKEVIKQSPALSLNNYIYPMSFCAQQNGTFPN
jgi:hypothetical protein